MECTKQQVEEILKETEAKLVEFMASGKYKDVLLAMGNLGRYSLNNQLWLLFQNPEVTTVFGLREWNEHGRCVKRGEKALRILAPVIKNVLVAKKDEDGKVLMNEEGEEVKEKRAILYGFKLAYVFDISQTFRNELDVFRLDETATVPQKEKILSALRSVISENGYTFSYADAEVLGQRCYGHCDYLKKEILVLKDMGDLHTIKTLVHECAHMLAHQPVEEGFDGITLFEQRQVKEIEAESISCVVASYLGLDTQNYNFSYITSWAEGDLEKFRHNIERIGEFSSILIKRIDAELYPKKEEPKNRKVEQRNFKRAKVRNRTVAAEMEM